MNIELNFRNTAALLLWAMAVRGAMAGGAFYGDPPDAAHAWAVHDMRRPAPPVVTPGAECGAPPSDAIVLFDGTSLEAWETVIKDEVKPAAWRLVEGAMEAAPKSGSLQTKQEFGPCQLHIEWRTPEGSRAGGQGDGNSGVIFMGGRYEVQVLNSHGSVTYPDGQAASLYAQSPPLVNASRPRGEWQSYDIVFHPPRLDANGAAIERGSCTVFHNGVLVQDHWLFEGSSGHRRRSKFGSHPDQGPLLLQDHGNPVRYRNVWIRPLPARTPPSEEEVRALRQRTADGIRAEAAQADGWQRCFLLLESLVYADDAAARAETERLLAAYASQARPLDRPAVIDRQNELKEMQRALAYCVAHKILPTPPEALALLEEKLKSADIKF